MKPWLKRLPLPGALVAALWSCITGNLPGGFPVDDYLAVGIQWVEAHMRYPIPAAFIFGLLLAWLGHQIGEWWVHGRRLKHRKKLNTIRNDGVSLRIEVMQQITNETHLGEWWDRAEAWNRQAIKGIEKLDEADAGQFATLDFPGKPRAPLPNPISNDHHFYYTMHDVRLVRLAELMTHYSRQPR